MISTLAVVTNCALLIFDADTDHLFNSMGARWVAFFVLEHTLLGIKSMVTTLVPGTPYYCEKLRQRHDHLWNKLLAGDKEQEAKTKPEELRHIEIEKFRSDGLHNSTALAGEKSAVRLRMPQMGNANYRCEI
jgi:hypothetical protein